MDALSCQSTGNAVKGGPERAEKDLGDLFRRGNACGGFRDDRFHARSIAPNGGAERNKIGASAGELRNLIGGFRKGDARNFKDFHPPGHTLDDCLERRRLSGSVRLAEHHIVGARFTRGHGIIAGDQAARAGDELGL